MSPPFSVVATIDLPAFAQPPGTTRIVEREGIAMPDAKGLAAVPEADGKWEAVSDSSWPVLSEHDLDVCLASVDRRPLGVGNEAREER